MAKHKNKRKKAQSAQKSPAGSDKKGAVVDNSITSEHAKAAAKAAKPQRKGSSARSKRRLLQLLIAVPVVGVAGAAIHRHDVKQRELHDLSVLGAGKPTVVQIHDPACALCRRLMANTRAALNERVDVNYRVADVTDREGAAFAKQYNAGNVTLLLFNAKGNRIGTLQGVSSVQELSRQFAALALSSE